MEDVTLLVMFSFVRIIKFCDMERMTRNQAAEFLGVSPQTITNWVESGLLGGYNDKKSRRFYVNGDDVRRYFDKYKLIAVSESIIEDRLVELRKCSRQVEKKMESLASDAFNISCFNNDDFGVAMCKLMCSLVYIPERYVRIMRKFLTGSKIGVIAQEFDLTAERVRQIVVRCMRKLCLALDEVNAKLSENDSLKSENDFLKARNAILEGADKKEELGLVAPVILLQPLVDFNLSVRCMNVLYSNKINTLGDLVRLDRDNVLMLRNLGKKSLSELDDLLEKLGLEWGMPVAKVYARGLLRNEDKDFLDNSITTFVCGLSKEFEKKYSMSSIDATNMAFSEIRRYVGKIEKMNNDGKQKI